MSKMYRVEGNSTIYTDSARDAWQAKGEIENISPYGVRIISNDSNTDITDNIALMATKRNW